MLSTALLSFEAIVYGIPKVVVLGLGELILPTCQLSIRTAPVTPISVVAQKPSKAATSRIEHDSNKADSGRANMPDPHIAFGDPRRSDPTYTQSQVFCTGQMIW